MSIRYREGTLVVRCDSCPSRPVLPTPCEIDTDRCVRCQHHRLDVPHPENHLCRVCCRECPDCDAPTTEGGRCRTCRGCCRNCNSQLPARPEGEIARQEAEARKDGPERRWSKVYVPRTWDQDLCEACRSATSSPDPVRAVLAALPAKIVRACGGTATPAVLAAIRAELQQRTSEQLIARIERRWWGNWASRPLHRNPDDQQDGYQPGDVALHLLAPTACDARCEDGWAPDNPDRACPTCRSGPTPRARNTTNDDPTPTAPGNRTVAEAVTHRPPIRECEGKDGACGVPVAAPYTQCPACSGWPRCGCGRRYDPERASGCNACTYAPEGA